MPFFVLYEKVLHGILPFRVFKGECAVLRFLVRIKNIFLFYLDLVFDRGDGWTISNCPTVFGHEITCMFFRSPRSRIVTTYRKDFNILTDEQKRIFRKDIKECGFKLEL